MSCSLEIMKTTTNSGSVSPGFCILITTEEPEEKHSKGQRSKDSRAKAVSLQRCFHRKNMRLVMNHSGTAMSDHSPDPVCLSAWGVTLRSTRASVISRSPIRSSEESSPWFSPSGRTSPIKVWPASNQLYLCCWITTVTVILAGGVYQCAIQQH